MQLTPNYRYGKSINLYFICGKQVYNFDDRYKQIFETILTPESLLNAVIHSETIRREHRVASGN